MTAGTVSGRGVEWETGEDRLRRIAQLTRTEAKRRRPPDPRSLLDALDAGAYVSRRELRELAHPHGLAVASLYLTFAPDPPQPPIPPLTAFHSMRHQELQGRREYVEGLERAARMRLERDLGEIEAFLRALVPPDGMRSLVVFKSDEELNRVATLPVRVRNRLVLDPDPYTVPLDVVLETHPRVLLIHVEKDQAHLAVHHLGHEQPVEQVRSFVPHDDVDKSRPGKVQRHRLTHRHWHLRAVERAMVQQFEEQECEVIVLSGDERVLAVYRELLAEAWRARVVGEYHPTPEETKAERTTRIEEIVAGYRAAVEARELADLPKLRAYGLLVSGLPDVVDAANRFLVRRLAVSDALESAGFVCRAHHYLALQPGACPWDSAPLLAAENVVDELVEFSRLHGVTLVPVAQRRDLLEPYAGIAGVLYPPAG